MCDLPNNEEALHTAQMQLLPSRAALNELMLWMDGVETALREREPSASLIDVQQLLQKYRVRIGIASMIEYCSCNTKIFCLTDERVVIGLFQGLKVDFANKQLTVDFVNQSAAQASQTEPQWQQVEKMEFAEKQGVMNQRYVALSRFVLTAGADVRDKRHLKSHSKTLAHMNADKFDF